MLHHLERGAKNGATEVAASLPKRAGEALVPAGPEGIGGNDPLFIFGIGNDLGQFRGDVVRVQGLTTKAGKHNTRIFDPASLDIVTGGLGEEIETNGEDQTPRELDADWNAVRAGISP